MPDPALIFDVQKAHAHFDRESRLTVLEVTTPEGQRVRLNMTPMLGLQVAHEEERAFFRRHDAPQFSPAEVRSERGLRIKTRAEVEGVDVGSPAPEEPVGRRPIVFLDVDGVLNSERHFRAMHAAGQFNQERLCPEAVGNLNRLLGEAGAQVVVSSTWRLNNPRIRQQLEENGVELTGRFRGCTPDLSAARPSGVYTAVERGHEIQAWLNQNGEAGAPIVILDDDADMAHLATRLVKTSGRIGLTHDDADRALAILREEVPRG